MCGIAGFSLTGKEKIDPRPLAEALLLEIQSRGRDATGMAWTDRKASRIRVRKGAMPAGRFVAKSLKALPAQTTTAVLHTRYATQGSPQDNGNNHPILRDPIVGVHNGHIVNDGDLFAQLREQRLAEVDSEAAFALLAGTTDRPEEVLGRLEGRAALAWLDRRNADRLHLARVTGSPLAVAQTKGGSLIFASTRMNLQAALLRAGIKAAWQDELDEGTYLTAQFGRVCDYLPVSMPDPELLAV